MGFLTTSKETEEILENQDWAAMEKYAGKNNHTLYRDSMYCYGYALTDNTTKKQYYFDRINTNFPGAIFNQIRINLNMQKAKKIDLEWLWEKDKRKRRKIYASNKFRQ